ncbi:hypothetical protein Dimus_022639, partial [Dionaea muscipula]
MLLLTSDVGRMEGAAARWCRWPRGGRGGRIGPAGRARKACWPRGYRWPHEGCSLAAQLPLVAPGLLSASAAAAAWLAARRC